MSGKNTNNKTTKPSAKAATKSAEVKTDNPAVELEALKTALATEKEAHQETLQKFTDCNTKLKEEVDAHATSKQALADVQKELTTAKETINEKEEEIKQANIAIDKANEFLDEIENNTQFIPGTLSEAEETGCSLDEALECVSVQVPTLKDGEPQFDSEGKQKTHTAKVEAHEVFAFRDHGDHVVVVTKSGNKIRGDKK